MERVDGRRRIQRGSRGYGSRVNTRIDAPFLVGMRYLVDSHIFCATRREARFGGSMMQATFFSGKFRSFQACMATTASVS